MGKSLPSTTFARIIASDKLRQSRQSKPVSRTRVASSPEPAKQKGTRVEPERLLSLKMEERSEKGKQQQQQEEGRREPLAEVVSDCVRRWFQDTLKEAKAGDSGMQVLVGQMYFSGYGVPRDAQKGRAWISKASRSRSSVWKVSDKHPGYNASDSDSDDVKDDAK